ncbi:zinc-dependent metalloprotease [Kocuria rhizophila]|nr:zinc-dependent metalloprotease [Kocuria rhizophila]
MSDAMKPCDLWLKDNTAFDEAPVMPARVGARRVGSAPRPRGRPGRRCPHPWPPPLPGHVRGADPAAAARKPPRPWAGGPVRTLSGARSTTLARAWQAVGCPAKCSPQTWASRSRRSAPLRLPPTSLSSVKGLDLPASDVLLYLAIREAAHARLFHGVPAVAQDALDLITAFASDTRHRHGAHRVHRQGPAPHRPLPASRTRSSGASSPR